VKKPKRFLRRLFQATVEIIKRMMPQATLIDFHQVRQFSQACPFRNFLSFWVLFLSLPKANIRPKVG